MDGLFRRNPGEGESDQSVQEFVEPVMPFVLEHPEYRRAQILERIQLCGGLTSSMGRRMLDAMY
jgi:hypothetical protein